MPSQHLKPEQIQKLPYLACVPTDGRSVPLLTYFDGATKDWHLYLLVKPGELGRVAGGEPITGSYVSSEVVDAVRDVEFKLGALVVRRMSFSDALEQLGRIESGVHRCCAVLEKYEVLWANRGRSPRSGALLVQSELEYLLLLLRSLYDDVQGLVSCVGRRMFVENEEGRTTLKTCPAASEK